MNKEYSIRKVQGIVGENSLSIVLPKTYAVDLGIGKGDYVIVKQEGKKIWIEKEEKTQDQMKFKELPT